MSRRNRRRPFLSPIYSFGISWLIMAAILPMYKIWALILTICLCSFVSYMFGLNAARNAKEAEKKAEKAAAEQKQPEQKKTAKKSYGPEIDPIVQEGDRALGEMGRLYSSIKDNDVRMKINELMRITDKIKQDAIEDPSDIPQIKKFMNYYLPTTIKLLNAYDRMSSQGIEGETLDKSMKSINEMLDAAIVAYKKRLDSLFENQALDIETDIDVMNQMLAREGLIGEKDFNVQSSGGSM